MYCNTAESLIREGSTYGVQLSGQRLLVCCRKLGQTRPRPQLSVTSVAWSPPLLAAPLPVAVQHKHGQPPVLPAVRHLPILQATLQPGQLCGWVRARLTGSSIGAARCEAHLWQCALPMLCPRTVKPNAALLSGMQSLSGASPAPQCAARTSRPSAAATGKRRWQQAAFGR